MTFKHLLILFLGFSLHLNATTFTVTNLTDNSAGSLREAITSANASAGLDTIQFSVSGAINLASGLPDITDSVVIDGTTAPGYVACGAPVVAIDGTNAGGFNGFLVLSGSSGSHFKGLNIRRFEFTGILFSSVANCQVTSCYIGTDSTGTIDNGNQQTGIQLERGADGIRIGGASSCERNIISGNNGNGILIVGSQMDTVSGNYIGLDATGTVGIGNAENGITLFEAPNTTITGNTIADHDFHAMVLNGSSDNSTIQGNKAGTDATGTVAIGNEDSGVIIINTTGTLIGGTGPGEGNILVASKTEYGIFIVASNQTTVQGNFIGTDASASIDLGNTEGGIRIIQSSGITIGGAASGAANTIAYNGFYGVGDFAVTSDSVLISRNSFFCNTVKGIDLNMVGNNNFSSPVITSATSGGASGTAPAFATVELYNADDMCSSGPCQGKTFIASVAADMTGNWTYSGALAGTITALAINTLAPGVNNTSEFSTCIVTSAVPVELSFFTGRLINEQVELTWQTATEVNNKSFVIERSQNGLAFYEIGEREGIGTTNVPQQYSFYDPNPMAGANYYRLRQIDFDVQFEYSEIILIENQKLESQGTIVFPNPNRFGLVQLQYTASKETDLEVELFDNYGRRMRWQNIKTRFGRNSVTLDYTDLPQGIYYIRIGGNVQKIIFQ
ncbi:MAG: NosD domain-containing protein [Bacteroidota bacterium]